jgi:hypothetical protein
MFGCKFSSLFRPSLAPAAWRKNITEKISEKFVAVKNSGIRTTAVPPDVWYGCALPERIACFSGCAR